jgi:hypothetical protein
VRGGEGRGESERERKGGGERGGGRLKHSALADCEESTAAYYISKIVITYMYVLYSRWCS